MKLLLHTCCAPCAIYPISEAKEDNFFVTGFFYNPNIHPRSEYTKRKEEAKSYFKSQGLEMIQTEYTPSKFFENITETTSEPPGFGRRCVRCWEMRLDETASFAKEKRFDAFTTTLLGSPYQDHEALKKICANISKEENIHFYYKDFRTGFKDAHRLAAEKGIYCQNYCGCVFSIVEREEAKRRKEVNVSLNLPNP